MTTITEIRDQLIVVFNGLRDGTIEPKAAIEVNNTAGKIIGTAKVQLAYHALRGESPDIPFLAAKVMAKRKEIEPPAMKGDNMTALEARKFVDGKRVA